MVKARRLKRRREEEHRRKDRDLIKTVEEVFDSFTLSHVFRLEKKGVIWELKGVVSSGKEARVYWGKDKRGNDIAVKIYLSATAEFRKSIKKYIVGDPRFENIPKGNFRKLIYEWTRKEYRNLKKMRKAGVRVPEPYAFSGNVLVMEFLGESGYRAPLIAEVIEELPVAVIQRYFNDIIDNYKKIVCVAELVHADLSEYNIMIWQDKPWIIDVSQAVALGHPNAQEFLERDIVNLFRFFEKFIDITHSENDLLEELSKCLMEKER